MDNYKHLTLSDRIIIEQRLNEDKPTKEIALELHKDASTISKEVKRNRMLQKPNLYGRDCDYLSSLPL